MLERFKASLDQVRTSPLEWLLALSGILMVRFFLEALSSPTSSGIVASDAPTLLHYYLFFLGVALALMLVLQTALPSWKKSIPVMTLFALMITSIPPVIDWAVSGGHGQTMAYLFQSPALMGRSLLTFFGPYTIPGITIGIRIELAAIILGTAWFIYKITQSIYRSIVTAVSIYVISFVAVSIPGIISAMAGFFSDASPSPAYFWQSSISQSSTLLDTLHGTLKFASLQRAIEIGFDYSMGRVWIILIVAMALAWFLTNYRTQTISMLRNYRPERLGHFFLMIAVGMISAYTQRHFSLNWNDWLTLATLVLAFYFSWMSAVCVNDAYDVDIDAISNADRPIPLGGSSVSEMKSAALIFFLLALAAGYFSGYYAFFCVLAFNALYYIYSAPPVRFKRVPFLSAFVIGFCSLSAALAGFFTFSVAKEVSAFPAALIVAIVAMFSLLPNIRDLKDFEGDRAAGIKTIPTLFGPVWGPRVTGFLAGLAYLVIPLAAAKPVLFLVAVPAAIATYFLAVKKPYIERPIFLIYGIFALVVGFMFLRHIF